MVFGFTPHPHPPPSVQKRFMITLWCVKCTYILQNALCVFLKDFRYPLSLFYKFWSRTAAIVHCLLFTCFCWYTRRMQFTIVLSLSLFLVGNTLTVLEHGINLPLWSDDHEVSHYALHCFRPAYCSVKWYISRTRMYQGWGTVYGQYMVVAL